MPLIPLFVPRVSHKIGTHSSGNIELYPTTAFTPNAGELLVAFVAATGTLSSGALTSDASLTFTKITSTTKDTTDTVYAFVSNQFATAASQTVTFDCTGAAGTGAVVVVAGISNMLRTGSAAIKQFAVQTDGTAGNTPAPAFSLSVLSNNPTLGGIANNGSPPAITPPTDWTELDDLGHVLPNGGLEYVSRDSGFTGTTITWGSTSATIFSAIILEMDSSPAAAGGNQGNFFSFF